MRTRTAATVLACLLACGHTPVSAYQGFPSRYTVHVGDFNGNGLLDLYLRAMPNLVFVTLDDIQVPIMIPPAVADFVLVQNPSGGFDVIAGLTPGEQAMVGQWPTAAVDLTFFDHNGNGFTDVLISGVGDVIPGAYDVVVFAPMAQGAAPVQTMLWDPSADSFEQYRYDELGRLRRVTYGDGTVIEYEYDPAGNRTEVKVTGASG